MNTRREPNMAAATETVYPGVVDASNSKLYSDRRSYTLALWHDRPHL